LLLEPFGSCRPPRIACCLHVQNIGRLYKYSHCLACVFITRQCGLLRLLWCSCIYSICHTCCEVGCELACISEGFCCSPCCPWHVKPTTLINGCRSLQTYSILTKMFHGVWCKRQAQTHSTASGQRTLLPPAVCTGERVVPTQKATEEAALARTDHSQSRHRHCPFAGRSVCLLEVVDRRRICLTRR